MTYAKKLSSTRAILVLWLASGLFHAAGGADQGGLRFYEIYGATRTNATDNVKGDAGEYIVLTNLSDRIVSLTGLTVSIAKYDAESKIAEPPKLLVTFSDGQIPARGSFRMEQRDYPWTVAGGVTNGWDKITNGSICLCLADATNGVVQSGHASFDNDKYVNVKYLGGALRAKRFDVRMKDDTDHWTTTIKNEYVFEGDYDTVQTVAPTGAECKVVLRNANFRSGFAVSPGLVVKFNAETGTVSTFSSIAAAKAEVRFTGDGTVRLSGPDTLMEVRDLVVKAGTLEIVSTGVAGDKTAVVDVGRSVEQTGGAIDLDCGVSADGAVYGICLREGGKSALFEGGRFKARIGGTKSAAIQVEEPSVDAAFKGGERLDAELAGPEARFANAAGGLHFGNCTVTVGMPGACAALTGARVFKAGKDIGISGGHYVADIPAADSEIFSAGDEIAIDGGTFELVASDDCFSAFNRITVNGGLIYARSEENDVFDSNGDMELNGGTILAHATAEGHEAFDVDPEKTEEGRTPHQLRINGGTIFATGGADADWPKEIVATGAVVYAAADLAAASYGGKFLSVEDVRGVLHAARLPSFPGRKCAVLATCPDRVAADPSVSASAPASGSRAFHDYYVYEKVSSNQDALRFFEIYGATRTNATDNLEGDAGEYVVLTNLSGRAVRLCGLSVEIAKRGDEDDPKCRLKLEAGEVSPYGTVRLDQADYAQAGWNKISNGRISIRLVDVLGAVVQSGEASFDNDRYPDTDRLGAALRADRFDVEMFDEPGYWWTSKSVEVRFDLGQHGVRRGGGELVQTVAWGRSAVAPEVTAEAGYAFDGWEAAFDDVRADLTVKARYRAAAQALAFAESACAAAEGDALVVRVSGGCAERASRATVHLAYLTAAAADLDLKRATVDGAESKAGLRFPLTLTWAAGETAERVIRIPVKADKTVEADETLVFQLGSVEGQDFGARALCLATIRDPGHDALRAKVEAGTATKAEQATWKKLTANADVPYVAGLAVSAERGKVTGGGYCAAGGKVTLKATANKGYVFYGWYAGDGVAADGGRAVALPSEEPLSRCATLVIDRSARPAKDSAAQTVLTDVAESATFSARFITADEDGAAVSARVNGAALEAWVSKAETRAYATNLWAGVYLAWPVAAEGLTPTTVRVSGLPSGLKFAAAPVTVKTTTGSGGAKVVTVVTNVPANTIYGIPTAASKTRTDRQGNVTVTPSAVKVTVTTAGKSVRTYQIDATVDALPAWAVGTFAGPSYADGTEGAATNGTAAVTVGANGRISAKQPADGRTASFSASGFDRYDAATDTFSATLTARVGAATLTNRLVLAAGSLEVGGETLDGGVLAAERFDAWQYRWKSEPWKSLAAAIVKAHPKATMTYAVLSDGTVADAEGAGDAVVVGRVTLKFAASGTVTEAGEFATLDAAGQPVYRNGKAVTVKATGSTVLVPVTDGGRTRVCAFVYLAPKNLPPHARCVEVASP